MDLARCDDCCKKLDGIDGHSVYILTDMAIEFLNSKSRELLDGEYEHLCEDCMDDINLDEEKLCINEDNHIDIIKEKS